jgi:protoporphyrinogen IX oxidase
MDIVFDILLSLHLLAFGLGISTTIVAPLLGARLPKAAPETRQTLLGVMGRLTLNARVALATLVLTGIAMMFVRYDGFAGQNGWFQLKMTLVVVIVAASLAGAFLKPGTLNPRLMSWITRLSMLGIVISAVLAFN